MDIRHFRDIYGVDEATNLLSRLDLNDPSKSVVNNNDNITAMLQHFIRSQSETTSQLIQFVGTQVTENRQVDGNDLTPAQQHQLLSEIANKQNLMSRQIEKNLSDQLSVQMGLRPDVDQTLVNEHPGTFGTEAKISDSSLRLITPFSGDDAANCENELTIFLREIYTISQTNNLTEETTINILVRKLSGSAMILIDDYISQQDKTDLKLNRIVGHLERKFLMVSSPYLADSKLHEIKIGNMSYSQLHAQITRLAKLATRLEPKDKREPLIRVKENSAFLNAINAADRSAITAENVRREAEHLTQLNIDQMSNLLTQRSADNIQAQESIFKANENSLPKVPMPGAEKVNLVDPPPPPGPQPFRGRGQNRGRGAYNNRGRGRGNYRFHNYDPNKRVTNEQAGVPDHCCLLCGDPSHKYKDPACKYFGQQLMHSKCRKCKVGAHPTKSCLQ